MQNSPTFVDHVPEPNEMDGSLARLAQALGHPHRIAIIRYLMEHPGCVCGEIVDALPVAQSTVSQHLKKLKDAGWIKGEIEGPRRCYCLNNGVIARFRELVETINDPSCTAEACECEG